jgi:MarR family transcriptional regulator, organic hydroperoxide resistance regulator
MNKSEKIGEINELFRLVGHSMARYACEYWKNLEVPLAQLKSLVIISIRGSINIHNLALELEVTPGNVTGIVDRLLEQGLVVRTQDLGDRRINILQLTEKGRDVISNIHEAGMYKMVEILNHLDQEGLEYLERGTRAFLAAIEAHQKENSEQDP